MKNLIYLLLSISFSTYAFADYDFEGIVKLNNCSGSVIKFAGQPETAKAIIMTNGHCITGPNGGMLAAGEVLVNYASSRTFDIFNSQRKVVKAASNKILFATMTNTDVAFYETTITYKKQVIKEPARVDDIPIPAEYAIVKRRVIDEPAKVLEETVPAITKTITKTILAKKGGMTVWEEVDCNVANGVNLLPINYELNSALLTAESKRIINETLLIMMKQKQGLRIEIMSHTDSRSDDSYNMALSQQRAQSVVNYLVSNGISRSRLVARGYGENRLKNDCGNNSDCSEEDHRVNRRTEFRIIR